MLLKESVRMGVPLVAVTATAAVAVACAWALAVAVACVFGVGVGWVVGVACCAVAVCVGCTLRVDDVVVARVCPCCLLEYTPKMMMMTRSRTTHSVMMAEISRRVLAA